MARSYLRYGFQRFLHVGAAAAAVIVALLLRQILVWHFGFHLGPFITFYAAIMLIALVFGLRAGLAATLMAAVLDMYWVLPPIRQFSIAKEDDVVELALFVLTGIFMSAVSELYLHGRKKLDAALASMTDVLFLIDAKGRLIKYNPAFITFFKFRSKGDCPRTLAELWAILGMSIGEGEPAPQDMWPGARVLRGETVSGAEYTLRRKDTGATWTGSYNFSPIRGTDGAIVGAVVSAQDITERKQAEKLLRASETRYRSAFQTSLDGMIINHLSDGRFVDANRMFLNVTGYDREEIIGRTSLELGIWMNPHDREHLVELLRKSGSYRDFHAQFRKKNGDSFSGIMSSSTFDLDGEPCLLSVLRDISEAKKTEEEIRHLSLFDPLTGLANRRQLMEQFRGRTAFAGRSRHNWAVLFVDLDDFKTLNDALGHQTGDLLLQEVARRLAACVSEVDTVARSGGDEFVLILKDLSETPDDAKAQARVVADKILDAVGRPYHLDGRACIATCSIGITIFGVNHENINDVLQQAELAMYQAKAEGRNIVRVFVPALQAAVNARAEMEGALREGIKTNQFMLYYQPQVEHGRVIGAETLVRWNHPSLGILSPGEFISLAEETKLILPLGDWILETACRQIAAWAQHEQTAQLKIAVNISAVQLRKDDFVPVVSG